MLLLAKGPPPGEGRQRAAGSELSFPAPDRRDHLIVQGGDRVPVGLPEQAAHHIALAVDHGRRVAEILVGHGKVIGQPLRAAGGERVGFVAGAAGILEILNHFLWRAQAVLGSLEGLHISSNLLSISSPSDKVFLFLTWS